MILNYLKALIKIVIMALKLTNNFVNFLVKKCCNSKKQKVFPEDEREGRVYFWANMPEFVLVVITLIVTIFK